MAAAGAYGAIGPAAAAVPELIDEHWLASGSRDASEIDHDPWDAWLKRYIVLGDDGIARVRYGEVSAADRSLLAGYIDTLAGIEITSYPRHDQLAYWINLYNALTVDLILRNYPVASIRDITEGLFSFGPWDTEVVEVEGRSLSLDDIEHGIVRPIWRDPRVHYGLNCASIGCPNLAGTAYRGADVDAMLEVAALAYVNHPRGAAIDQKGRLVVSSIYIWFQEDFGGDEAGVIDHLRAYATEPLKGQLADATSIHDDLYDWSLNDAAVR
jgi:Protein of unknown function, DUF547